VAAGDDRAFVRPPHSHDPTGGLLAGEAPPTSLTGQLRDPRLRQGPLHDLVTAEGSEAA
jgi:hypothetical protein